MKDPSSGASPETPLEPGTVVQTYTGRPGVVVQFLAVMGGLRFYRISFGNSMERLPESDFFVPAAATPWQHVCGPDAVRRVVTELKVESRTRDTLASMSATTTRFYPYQYKPLLKLLRSPHERILVGDEVGLGKTIEAGFTLLEILARQPDASVLIVCPPMLREKWRRELADRFGISFSVLRSREADRRIAKGERSEADGPLRAIVSYETIRRVEFTEALEQAVSPNFDLLVVDEAHRARKRSSAQSRAVEQICSVSQKVVFLTATPMQTEAADLGRLLGILLPQEFPSDMVFEQRQRLNTPVIEAERAVNGADHQALGEAIGKLRSLQTVPASKMLTSNPSFEPTLGTLERLRDDLATGALTRVQSARRRIEAQSALFEINLLAPFFTRTRRVDIQEDMPVRQAYPVTMDLTEYESAIYHELSEAIFREYERRYGHALAQLVIVNYQARLASSIAASVRHFREMLDAEECGSGPIREDDPNMTELFGGESGDEGAAGVSELDEDGRPKDEPERSSIAACREVARIVRGADLARLEREDSKWRLLSKVLDDHMAVPDAHGGLRKMILFSYYKRSLDLVGRRLTERGVRFERIDGDVPSCPEDPEKDERLRRITRFRDDPETTILISSQVGTEGLDFQFCDTVVNWDLPWNPMTVEQRIGRIDRIGQQAEVLHIVNVVCRGTVEWRILDRLYRRIRVFEQSIGDVGEILGPIERQLHRELMVTGLTERQLEDRIEDNAVAAENKLQLAQKVERESTSLIGQDRFLVDEVARLKRAGKYLTAGELRHFVCEQVRKLDGNAAIASAADGNLTLRGGPQLLTLVDDAMRRHRSPDWIRFANRLRGGAMRIAFEGGETARPKDVELIGAAHPLVRVLATRLDAAVAGTQHFLAQAASDVVPDGVWAIAVSIMKEQAGDAADASILCAAIRADGGIASDDDVSDDLLHAVVTNGLPWSGDDLDIADRSAIGALAERAMLELYAGRRQARLSEAHRDAERRRAVIEADFEARAARIRQKIGGAEGFPGLRPNVERILPLFRAQLATLEVKRDAQLEQLARRGRPSISETAILLGIVRVTKPSHSKEAAS